MKIAIPSHNRLQQFLNKTYALLMKHNFNSEDIFIFVSPESFEEYDNYFNKNKLCNVILSKDNILDTRNHIIEYFNEGEQIVEMDDDIEDIVHTIKEVKSTSVEDLKTLFLESFQLCQGGLWGFNAQLTSNNFFASGEDRVGHWQTSIVNSCLGYYNNKNISLSVPEKEDFERVILFYKNNIPILKRGQFGIKTKYWTNKGGIQDRYDFNKRKEVQLYSANMILEKYPGHAYTYTRKNGIVDIRFYKTPK
jgi:hypothetical protein